MANATWKAQLYSPHKIKWNITEKSYQFFRVNGVFAKWIRNSVNSANSGNLINHWSINWGQFKDPLSYLRLDGAVVASWSLTQEVTGSNPFDDWYFCHWIQDQLSSVTIEQHWPLPLPLPLTLTLGVGILLGKAQINKKLTLNLFIIPAWINVIGAFWWATKRKLYGIV